MSKIKKNIEIADLEIVDTSTEGMGVGKKERMVVFVEGAIPGDKVNALIYRKKNSFAQAKLTELITPSPYRLKPVCQHFGTCGGCKWQHMTYNSQLLFKHKHVLDSFERIGKLDFPEIKPVLPSADVLFYRNKLEFSFSNKRWLTPEEIIQKESITDKNALGFHIPGMFDKVLNIQECFLQPNPSNDIRLAVYDFALKNKFTFFDIRNKTGFLRTLMIRNNIKGDFMVLISMFENLPDKILLLCEFLKNKFPCIKSLQYVHNPKGNDSLHDLTPIVFFGEDYIVEAMEGLEFRISAKSFYQPNPKQALELYKIARDFASPQKDDIVYDLYSGTGTISQFVARYCKKVIGVEYVEEAVLNAKENASFNKMENVQFVVGDMKKVFTTEFVERNGKPDIIITDPPRSGMDREVVEQIMRLLPRKIVYVSCNPATQARDIAMLKECYSIVSIQPVDMFPQTSHVENVVLLIRNSEKI